MAPIIQLSISPVILISGVGALSITLTNRMGRIVDRTRVLAVQVGQAAEGNRQHLETLLAIMWRRSQLIRQAVTFAGCSMLASCLLVLGLFIAAFFHLEPGHLLAATFVTSILFLAAALVSFLRDIYLSLRALHLEVERVQSRR
ncbi:MAG: DUF2721 domain-containing protein [Opitutaceae bacterium]|nr:DUF2721 domain-containing protein [Opitutaceae bacterium]